MLNNKGFTLIEVLGSLVIISLITFLIVSYSGNTLSINKNRAYEIMKNNIYKVSQDYIKECEIDTLSCDLDWNNNETEFYAYKLRDAGFFRNMESPIDGRDVGDCLLIQVYKNDNKVNDISLVDKCY